MNKTDARILWTGCKRMLLSLLTEIALAITVFCFYAVTIETGYMAVILFIASLVTLAITGILLYALGITNVIQKESQGEDK